MQLGPGIALTPVLPCPAAGTAAAVFVQWCSVPGVPFEVEAPSGSNRVTLHAPAEELAAWLLSDASVLMCPVMPPAAELESLNEAVLQEAEAAALNHTSALLLNAKDGEAAMVQLQANVGHPAVGGAHIAEGPGMWLPLSRRVLADL